MASPDEHWFNWLKLELAKRDIEADIPLLPDSDAPSAEAWQQTLSESINRLDENVFIVAHSLGCISVLQNIAERISGSQLGGLLLVAGFQSKLEMFPQLNPFVETQVALDTLASNTNSIDVFASPQDPLVPVADTKALADKLNAGFHTIADAGHFLGSDGYTAFPEVLEVLSKQIGK